MLCRPSLAPNAGSAVLRFIAGPLLCSMVVGGAHPATAQTFDLVVNGDRHEVEVGKELELTVNGAKTKFKLERQEVTKYSDEMLSFAHPGTVEVTKKPLTPHAVQLAMTSAVGTVVLVQEYQGQDPTHLTELMINAITKSDVAEGYTLEQSDTKKTLANGKVLLGKAVTTTRGPKKHFFNFFSFGDDIKGLYIVTRIAEEEMPTEGIILSKFWETLSPKF